MFQCQLLLIGSFLLLLLAETRGYCVPVGELDISSQTGPLAGTSMDLTSPFYFVFEVNDTDLAIGNNVELVLDATTSDPFLNCVIYGSFNG